MKYVISLLLFVCLLCQICVAEEATEYPVELSILSEAAIADPASSALTKEAAIAKGRLHLKEIGYFEYYMDSIQTEAFLIYHDRFIDGDEPVWLLLFYRNNMLIHKMLLNSDGRFLDSVPAYFEFDKIEKIETYDQHSQFSDEILAANLVDLDFWNMSVEEKAAFSEKWNPIVDEYATLHPDLVDTKGLMYQATRHVYGIPEEGDMSQEKATEIAMQYLLTKGVSIETFPNRRIVYTYDVTDPDNPVWKLLVYHVAFDKITDPCHEFDSISYQVFINANSGEVIYSVDNTEDEFNGFNI